MLFISRFHSLYGTLNASSYITSSLHILIADFLTTSYPPSHFQLLLGMDLQDILVNHVAIVIFKLVVDMYVSRYMLYGK